MEFRLLGFVAIGRTSEEVLRMFDETNSLGACCSTYISAQPQYNVIALLFFCIACLTRNRGMRRLQNVIPLSKLRHSMYLDE